MNSFWGSILIALLVAAGLALSGRPAVASMTMGTVLTFWFGASFGYAGAYMELTSKKVVEDNLNVGGMVIMCLFVLFFFIVAVVIEGKRSKRLRKAEDRLRSIDRAERDASAR